MAIELCVTSVNKALELNPKHIAAYNNRASARYKIGENAVACED